MLEAPASTLERPRYPVIDIHTHLAWSQDDVIRYYAPPEELLPVMDRRGIRLLVNVTGGTGKGIEEAVQKYDRETEDDYFDYAPAPLPPQGRWRIYGLGLPDAILRKVYFENAAGLLQSTEPPAALQ